MPQLTFFQDDTLDYVYKMEEVFKKINEDKQGEVDGGQMTVDS